MALAFGSALQRVTRSLVRPAHLRLSASLHTTQLHYQENLPVNIIAKSPKKVFVFMKGNPEEPACGYSNAVVQILNAYGVDYDSFNVLSDDKIRQEVKSYSKWPTFPQVYVDGSFVGGCDILIQMHQNNELDALFEGKTKSPKKDK